MNERKRMRERERERKRDYILRAINEWMSMRAWGERKSCVYI